MTNQIKGLKYILYEYSTYLKIIIYFYIFEVQTGLTLLRNFYYYFSNKARAVNLFRPIEFRKNNLTRLNVGKFSPGVIVDISSIAGTVNEKT